MATQQFVRRVSDYHQDAKGVWWTTNPQRGFVQVPAQGRALRYALALDVLGFNVWNASSAAHASALASANSSI